MDCYAGTYGDPSEKEKRKADLCSSYLDNNQHNSKSQEFAARQVLGEFLLPALDRVNIPSNEWKSLFDKIERLEKEQSGFFQQINGKTNHCSFDPSIGTRRIPAYLQSLIKYVMRTSTQKAVFAEIDYYLKYRRI